jgi:uridine kinase
MSVQSPNLALMRTPYATTFAYGVHMSLSFESVSTWRQELPTSSSAVRRHLIDALARAIADMSALRLRVAVDGYTAAGKTVFSHELAIALRTLGRTTARASFDDFKHPWRHAREHGYDRLTGQGYYRNAYDFDGARNLLLQPAGPDGTGEVALCSYDPLTGEDHRRDVVELPPDSILIVDSVFAFRSEYNDFWDYRIWLDITPDLSLRRGIERDSRREGVDEATNLHRDRYHVAQSIYLAEVDPRTIADAVIDNSDYNAPRLLRPKSL